MFSEQSGRGTGPGSFASGGGGHKLVNLNRKSLASNLCKSFFNPELQHP